MTNGKDTVTPNAGAIVKEDFGARELSVVAETASAAVAAQARAAVEARYKMALLRPRDLDDVRVRLLRECKRPGFAEVARYHKPVGDGVEGPSIRFAEAAIRCMTNILPEKITVYDDDRKRIVRVTVTDLEANVTYSSDVVIEKVVERRGFRDRNGKASPPRGREIVGERVNSYGEKTYQVLATDDELLNKEAALVSKAIRSNALRLLPGDILDECMTTVIATLRDKAAQDPDAERKRISDGFAELGVKPSDLKQYLGHDLGSASPAELVSLRALYAAIRDGETNWPEALAHKLKRDGEPAAATPAGGTQAPEVTSAQPAPAPQTSAPAESDPPAEKTEPAPEADPVEKDLEQGFASATKPGDLLRFIGTINKLRSEDRKAHWREQFNRRREELSASASKPE